MANRDASMERIFGTFWKGWDMLLEVRQHKYFVPLEAIELKYRLLQLKFQDTFIQRNFFLTLHMHLRIYINV